MARHWWLIGGLVGMVLTAGQVVPLQAQQIREEPGRLVVIMVELAWLADPELCCYYPCARVESGKVMVDGYLPSAALRDKTLKIAALVTQLPIQDRTKIHPGCRFTHAQVASEQLLKNAAHTLKIRFPEEYQNWQLGLRGPGELVVGGPVESYEKKLLVSVKLRAISGCKSIANQMQVMKAGEPIAAKVQGKAPRPGPEVHPVLSPPVAMKPPVAAPPVLAMSAGPAPSAAPPRMVPQTQTTPLLKGPSATTQSNQNAKPSAVALGPSVQPMYGNPAAMPKPIPPRPAAAPPVASPYAPQTIKFIPTQPVASQPVTTKTVPVSPSAPVKGPALPGFQQMPKGSAAPAKNHVAKAATDKTIGHQTAYQGQPPPSPLTVWQAGQTKNKPPLISKAAPAPIQVPAAPREAIAEKQVVLSPPRPVPAEPAVKPLPPLPVIPPGRPLPPPPAQEADTAKVAALRELIQQAGGPLLSQLDLNLNDTRLMLRFSAPDEEEAERLAGLIMTMPALAAYRLELMVEVPR